MIRKELNLFSRYFNLLAHTPKEEIEAQKTLCVLMPEVAIIEEVIVILNPLYFGFVESAEKLIQRMGLKILNKKLLTLSEEDANNLFKDKISAS